MFKPLIFTDEYLSLFVIPVITPFVIVVSRCCSKLIDTPSFSVDTEPLSIALKKEAGTYSFPSFNVGAVPNDLYIRPNIYWSLLICTDVQSAPLWNSAALESLFQVISTSSLSRTSRSGIIGSASFSFW
ncbi:hypothetical protein D3C81_1727500 [compost metagenome]